MWVFTGATFSNLSWTATQLAQRVPKNTRQIPVWKVLTHPYCPKLVEVIFTNEPLKLYTNTTDFLQIYSFANKESWCNITADYKWWLIIVDSNLTKVLMKLVPYKLCKVICQPWNYSLSLRLLDDIHKFGLFSGLERNINIPSKKTQYVEITSNTENRLGTYKEGALNFKHYVTYGSIPVFSFFLI